VALCSYGHWLPKDRGEVQGQPPLVTDGRPVPHRAARIRGTFAGETALVEEWLRTALDAAELGTWRHDPPPAGRASIPADNSTRHRQRRGRQHRRAD
jgi:hypothetical protein